MIYQFFLWKVTTNLINFILILVFCFQFFQFVTLLSRLAEIATSSHSEEKIVDKSIFSSCLSAVR